MSFSASAMSASEAARQLGVSIKALRVYERCGLLVPPRTAAGYRVYHPEEMARAARIVALRSLGLKLSQVARVLNGGPQSAAVALAAHEQTLEKEIRRLASTLEKVRTIRTGRESGRAPQSSALNVAFDLPWPRACGNVGRSDGVAQCPACHGTDGNRRRHGGAGTGSSYSGNAHRSSSPACEARYAAAVCDDALLDDPEPGGCWPGRLRSSCYVSRLA